MKKPPSGFRAFDKLAKRLVAIPKEKVDAAIARKRKANKRSPQKG